MPSRYGGHAEISKRLLFSVNALFRHYRLASLGKLANGLHGNRF